MKQIKSSKQPLVSVVMPVFNAQDYLAEAINSILAQTYQHFRLWIVDDCSTDQSLQIARNFQKQYPKKIKVVKLKQKSYGGAGNGAINAVYPQLKGNYIARMDADDIALPNRLAKQVKFLQTHNDAVVVGCQAKIIDEAGKVRGQKVFPTDYKKVYQEFFVFHPLVHPGVMINRQLLPKRDYLYEKGHDSADDYLTFFSFWQYGKIYNLPNFLLKYRIHSTNASLNRPKYKFMQSLKIRFKAVKFYGYRPTFSAIARLAAQVIVISLMPEELIVPLYLLVRGIQTPQKIWQQLWNNWLAALRRPYAQVWK